MSTRLRYLYRAYRYRFRIDPAEIRFVRQNLRPGQVAVDIGCHKGAYTYWMRRRVGPSGVVYAFEPQPRQVAYLREAFSAMHYDNVVLVPMAVSDHCGQMPLYMPAESTHAASLEARSSKIVGWAPPTTTCPDQLVGGAQPTDQLVGGAHPTAPCSTLSVDVTTLDDFFTSTSRKAGAGDAASRGLHFVKIDVEGHELSVLEGARQTLQEHHPTILIECEARHRPDGDVRPVFDLLESFGYTGNFFCHGTRRPLAEFDSAVHQHIDPSTDRLPPGYVNNFAFEHVGKLGER